MTDFKTLIEASREARRIERRIKDLARKSMRAGEPISIATIADKTCADVDMVMHVVKTWLTSPRLSLRNGP